jgi:TonB dependent receptor/CarboxypepD_reg-like domain/TonB-dependent Receptor Plug Domain
MRNITFLCLLFSAFTAFSATHGGTIRGIIVSASDNALLVGASVMLEDQNRYTTSNEIGSFVFPDLENGEYTLRVTYLGYASRTLKIQVSNHETSNLKIELEAAAIDLGDVEVLAQSVDPLKTLSRLDIQLRPMQSSQEVLRLVPGLFIAQHAGGGKAEQIFLRGFDIDHGTDIALFADGIPVNMVSHAHGQGYADLHFLIPELVQQVDFQKGLYAAETGNFATAGQVRFQTPIALEHNFVKMEAGQFDSYRLATAVDLLGKNAAANGTHAYLAGEQVFSNAYFDAPQGFRRSNYFGKWSKTFEGKQSLSLSLSNFSSTWLASGQIPQRAVNSGQIGRFGAIDPTEGGQTGRFNANLTHNCVLSDKAWVKNQFYHSIYNFELYSNFTFFLDDSINGDQIRQKETRNMSGYNGSFHFANRILGRPFSLNTGVQFRLDDIKDNELSHSRNRRETIGRIAFGDVQEINAGGYFDAYWQLGPSISLQAGTRFDQFYYSYLNGLDSAFLPRTSSRNILSPKANLSWQASPKLQVFLRTGRGFHSNDTRTVLFDTDRNVLPAATGFDLGFALCPIPRLLLHATGWQLNLEQEFVYIGDAGIVEPGGRTQRRGIDFSARCQLSPWLFFDADYTWTHARAKEEAAGEAYIPLAPIHTATGGFTINRASLSGSVRGRWLGDRPANEDFSLRASGYFLIDAQLAFTPWFGSGKRPLEISISAQNVANVAWKEAQFETESRLHNEEKPVSEIHFTPGTPLNLKSSIIFRF